MDWSDLTPLGSLYYQHFKDDFRERVGYEIWETYVLLQELTPKRTWDWQTFIRLAGIT